MDALRSQANQLRLLWEQIYAAVDGNPALYGAHLSGLSPVQLDEVVKTVSFWMDRVKAPPGFAPGFQLAKAVAGTSLAGATAAAQGITRGEYAHFPAFVSSLNQLLSSLHTLLRFSDRDDARDVIGDLGGKLSEGLALVDTTQREMAAKISELGRAAAVIEESAGSVAAVGDAVRRSEELLKELGAAKASASAAASGAAAAFSEAQSSKEEIEELQTKAIKLLERADKAEKQVVELTKTAKSQQDLITALLPKGVSTGLASAFALRVSQVELTKRIWIAAFLVSLGSLFFTAIAAVGTDPKSAGELAWALLHRLPVAAPLVWVAWFSAIQYGNTVRIQEDYAFKEATSKAFAGYRDHLEHMSSVNSEEAGSAMNLLAVRTIEILAREPLRIFGRTERDVSPSQGVLEAATALMKGKVGEGA